MFARATAEGPLFSHLLSSRPPRDAKEGAAATAMSVVFHAAILSALVLATLSVGGVTPELVPDVIAIVLPMLPPPPAYRSAAPRMPTVAPVPGISLSQQPDFAPPTIVPGDYKAPTVSQIVGSDPIALEGNQTGVPGGTGASPDGDTDASHPFTVYTLAPRLRNGAEVSRALERNYPPLLRDSGIGGEVLLWLLVDEAGGVLKADLKQSSGHGAFDDAAMKIALTMKFSPAMNRDQKIKVWVAVPIRFSAR